MSSTRTREARARAASATAAPDGSRVPVPQDGGLTPRSTTRQERNNERRRERKEKDRKEKADRRAAPPGDRRREPRVRPDTSREATGREGRAPAQPPARGSAAKPENTAGRARQPPAGRAVSDPGTGAGVRGANVATSGAPPTSASQSSQGSWWWTDGHEWYLTTSFSHMQREPGGEGRRHSEDTTQAPGGPPQGTGGR